MWLPPAPALERCRKLPTTVNATVGGILVDFRVPRFSRRYIWIPAITAALFLLGGYLLIEMRVQASTTAAAAARESQDRLRALANLAFAVADAEANQRGYLLTRDRAYLEPYEEARVRLSSALLELRTLYRRDAAELARIATIEDTVDKKLVEMQETIDLVAFTGSTRQSVRVVRTGAGLRYMSAVRDELEGMSALERHRTYITAEAWDRQQRVNRVTTAAGVLTIVALLLIAAVFITRDIERRTAAAAELERLVTQRTAELSELSTHLQTVTETERANLARELHDELGGLLVSIKMDLAQLSRCFDITQPETAARWQRVMDAITAGVDLKRRVIEQLRPTLLDNMGLIAALQWQAHQLCDPAGIRLLLHTPDQEPQLEGNMAIAIFRIAQETLINMVKHARATEATLELRLDDRLLTLQLEDNGIGLPANPQRRTAHGLASMRHRARSIGATLEISAKPSGGTRTLLQMPLA